MILQLPATLTKSESRRNRAWRLVFETQEEIPGDVISPFNSNLDKYGWLAFLVGEKQIEIDDIKDLPELPKIDPEEKSPNQILYNRMFVYWKDRRDKGMIKDDFQDWRRKQLEFIGQQYLDKLN